ncbi:hypothetical protein ACWA1C_08220 [Flectobacillus roseus]
MNIKEIEKAVADVSKAQKSLESVYGKEFAASLLALAQNQLKQTKLHLESTKIYEGMSDEEIESQKAEEKRLEQEQLQEEMKQRLETMRPTTTAQEETQVQETALSTTTAQEKTPVQEATPPATTAQEKKPVQETAPPTTETSAPEGDSPAGENQTPPEAPATQA